MVALLNRKTLEAPLPHMTRAAVVPVISADMTGHPPLHEGTEDIHRGRLHDEIKMIGSRENFEDCSIPSGKGDSWSN